MLKNLIGKYLNTISGLQMFQLLRFGSLFLISIVFTKSSLTTELIGSYEIFMFISALLCSFWINGLIQSFLPLSGESKTFGKTGNQKSPELFNAFILISILSVVIIFILVIFRGPLSDLLNKSEEIPYFRLLLLYIFFSCPSFLIEYIYLLRNRPAGILTYGFLTFSIQIIMVSLPALLGYGMVYCIAGLVVISIIRYVWLLILLKEYAAPLYSISFMKEHIKCGYPLIISALLGSSAVYVDGVIVLHKFDSATFAIFRYGAKEFPLVVLLANAFSIAMIPGFSSSEKLTGALQNLRKKSGNMMHFLFPASIVLLFSSNWLYPLVFNENFVESARIFNIYLLLISSRLVFPHPILIGLKRTNIVMHASVAEFIVNASLSILFIRFWGIEGVAFATVIAYSFQKIIWIIYNKVFLNISPGQYIPLKALGIYSLILAVVFCFVY